MSIRRVLLVVNPAARSAQAAERHARHAFETLGVHAELVRTTGPGDARRQVLARGAEFDAVFTLGGDGTAMEVIPDASAMGMPVGVLPGGTGNLIVRALNIPLRVSRAVRALLKGTERRFDLGEVQGGHSFAFAAGVGVDVAMLEGASREQKLRLGVAAYVTPAVSAVLAREAFALHATVDGVTHTFQATTAFVANFGSVLGGMITLGPEIAPDDGWLDLCVFCPESVGDAIAMGWRVVRGDFRGMPGMHFLKGRTIRLETTPPRRVQADGELLGMTPMEVTVRPLTARLLVPA